MGGMEDPKRKEVRFGDQKQSFLTKDAVEGSSVDKTLRTEDIAAFRRA